MTFLQVRFSKLTTLFAGILLTMSLTGCTGMFSGGQFLETFKIGGPPGGQSEPDLVIDETASTKSAERAED